MEDGALVAPLVPDGEIPDGEIPGGETPDGGARRLLPAPELGGALDCARPRLVNPAGAEVCGQASPELTEAALRRRILAGVDAFHAHVHADRAPFAPGVSPVPVSGRVYGARDIESLVDASLDFWLTTGRCNAAFEKRFAEFLGVRHVLTVNSGSSANLVAVSALTSPKLGERRLAPGDEVITVAAGFPTTVNPILQNGLVPVFVDVDPRTLNVLPERLEGALGPRTRAVVLAHTLGNPFDVARVLDFCRRHDLWLVEDCCDALGSEYTLPPGAASFSGATGAARCGAFGHIATFSFYPAHHITMGEGGAVATQDGQLKKILESFRDWGRDCWCAPGCDNSCGCRYGWKWDRLPEGYDHKYVYSHLGYNLKITDMQAAVGLAQLDHLEEFIARRRENFALWTELLAPLAGVFTLPRATENSAPSWFGLPLTLRSDRPGLRTSLLTLLAEKRVGTRLLFGGNLVNQPYFQGRPHRVAGGLENTDAIMHRTFWLGVYPGLDRARIEYAAGLLAAWARREAPADAGS
ncbi:MAG: lipopolysaccharide biosynthesis protein RfbH [Desulfovibrionaceae bacterium]|nr:lipopolysaccharide biosynthesis protein RfbH [Desulfovibrionaceae bacterium]